MLKRNKAVDDTNPEETKMDTADKAPTQAMTEKKSRTGIAVSGGATGFLANAEDEGFGGMELNKNSFLPVVLDSGSFCDADTKDDLEMTDEDSGAVYDLSREMIIKPVSSRNKLMITVIPEGSKSEEDHTLHVQYSGESVDHLGQDMDEVLKDAEAYGHTVRRSSYLEAIAIVYKPDDKKPLGYDENSILNVVSLSIPPMSKSALAGAITIYNAKNPSNRVTSIGNAIIKCGLGKKRKGGKDKTYVPWKFTCMGNAPMVEDEEDKE